MVLVPPSPRPRAFTILELLLVIAIMAIMVTFSVLGWQSLNGAGKFNKAIGDISGILEQGRAYAIAQNTYVWVVFYETAPAAGPLEVYVGSFASNDGTETFSWVGNPPVTLPSSALTPINRLHHFRGIHLQKDALPNAPATPNFPASQPVFRCTAPGESGPVDLPDSNQVYWVIEFTPTGAARNGPNPIESIWFGMQPSHSKTALDAHNVVSLKVNGLTGLTTIYRP